MNPSPRPLPGALCARSHERLLAELLAQVRERFAGSPVPWDPGRGADTRAPDLGRGLLDCYALALHVLWVYQEAWGAEGFLPTARLDDSLHRLLAQVGYAPRPATAAAGLQHFRCRPGTAATLPPGFQVAAPAAGELPAVVYETLGAVRLDGSLNVLRPYLPGTPAPVPTDGAIAADADPALLAPRVSAPRPDSTPGDGAIVGALGDRLRASRAGDLARRNAERARQEAMQLAELADRLKEAGATAGPGGSDTPEGAACATALAQVCADLCAAQSLAAQVPDEPQPGPLSESQDLLMGQLMGLARRQPAALAAFEQALGRGDGESRADFSKRLDAMAGFLDALVAGLLQEARDNLVRLRGARALTRLDRAYGSREDSLALGVAPPGTDSLYLLPRVADSERGPETQTALLRPGDWLIVAEDLVRTGPDGESLTERRYREAIELVRVRDEVPAGLREPMTRIVFRPPLSRRYPLARTLLLGNCAPIGQGAGTAEPARPDPADPALLPLPQSPLTWIRDPRAPDGRRPAVALEVAGRSWRRVDALCGQSATAGVFALETASGGRAALRIGGGLEGAALPDPAEIRIRYRVGAGAAGNRPGGAVANPVSADPAVAETFNPLPLAGGSDAEPAAALRERAAAGVHGLDRVVSLADLRSLALAYGGVRCARVFRDPVRRERIGVAVCGDRGEALAPAELDALYAFLAARVPPGVAVRVENRLTLGVRARLALLIAPGADPLPIARELRLRLGIDSAPGRAPGLLAPERGELGGWLDLSDLYGAVAGVPDLAAVHVERFYRAGSPPARSERIALAERELAVWDSAGDALDLVWRELTP